MTSSSFPSFTICTICFPLLTLMVFVEVVVGKGFEEYEQFFDLFFMGACCQIVFCIIIQLKWIPPMEIPSRINYMKVFMLALLLILTVQTVAIFYVLFSDPNKDLSYKYMIAAYVVILTGTAPILIGFCLIKVSGSLFHTSDFLEWLHIIFGICACFPIELIKIRDRRALFALFSPLYVCILKGVYNVLFNSYEFIFYREQDRFVSCTTWFGKEFRGRLSNFCPLASLELQEVEIYEKGQRVDGQDKVKLFLINLKMVRLIEQPGLL